jgi:hypothetical protein
MTSEEYQDKTEELLKAQGVDMKREDDISSAIKIALSDINPESKFRHCENIRIAYLGTSPLGASIGLPSMGSKLVWCKYCKGCSSGFSLDLIFESFIEENCKGCKHLTPRPGDWVCTVKFVMDQEKDAEFHKIVENVRKHFS